MPASPPVNPAQTALLAAHELELPTKRRLVLVAERLFAEHGIDAVSLRAVNAAAGTNVASVHYHFGTKESLVEALIAERSEDVSSRRTTLLDALESGAAECNPHNLAAAFVQPVAAMIRSGAASWVKFIAGILATGHPSLSRVSDGFAPQAQRFNTLLAQANPGTPAETLHFRLTQAMGLTFRVLGDIPGTQRLLALSGDALDDEDVIEQLVDTVTAILAGPPGQPKNAAASS